MRTLFGLVSRLTRRPRQTLAALGLAAAITLSGPAYAVTGGSLDTTFDGDGKKLVSFGQMEMGIKALPQADGKLVIVGESASKSATGSKFALARLNPGGSLDTAFSGDGKATTDPSAYLDYASSAALQGDGKILVLGDRINTTNNYATVGYTILRYRTNGALDTSFSGDGKVFGSFGGSYQMTSDIAPLGTGKVLVLGTVMTSTGSSLVLARFNADGTTDTSFANKGKVVTSIGMSGMAAALAVQSDGKVVVAAQTSQSGKIALQLLRYNPNGALDSTFGTNGRSTTVFTATSGVFPSDVLVLGNGKIAVSGAYLKEGTTDFTSDFALLRFNAYGKLDTTFSGDGKVYTNFSSFDFAGTAVAQPDGKLVLVGQAGTMTATSESSYFALARYTTGGALDSTFGTGGKVVTKFTRPSGAMSGAMQGTSKIVAVGGVDSADGGDFAVVRYNK